MSLKFKLLYCTQWKLFSSLECLQLLTTQRADDLMHIYIYPLVSPGSSVTRMTDGGLVDQFNQTKFIKIILVNNFWAIVFSAPTKLNKKFWRNGLEQGIHKGLHRPLIRSCGCKFAIFEEKKFLCELWRDVYLLTELNIRDRLPRLPLTSGLTPNLKICKLRDQTF